MKAKRAKLNLIAVLFLILAVICAAAGVAFAYFSSSSGDGTYTIGTEIVSDVDGTSYVVTVSDFSALARVGKSSYYNSSSKVSSSSTYDRKVIKLDSSETDSNGNKTNVFTLENDLWITADVHINLNDNTLDLNGHTLTIQHSYAGTFTVYDGTIKAAKITTTTTGESGTETTSTTYDGGVVIDTPNASVLFDRVTDVDDKTISYAYDSETKTATANKYVTVLSCIETQNFGYAAYAALYAVGDALATDLDRRPDRLTYAEFSALSDTTTADDYKYAATNFLSKKVHRGDTSTDDTYEVCTYVKVGCDLNLPTHYLSTDYTITYTSTAATALSVSGNALAAGDTTLTVTVNDGTDSASVSFTVHVVSGATTAIAQTLIESYLLQYDGDGDGTYVFSNAFQLPIKDTELGISLSYKLDHGVVLVSGKAYTIEATTESTKLYVYMDNSTKEDFTLNIKSDYVSNDEAIANLIISKLYGGAIVYDYSSDGSGRGGTKLDTYDDLIDYEYDSGTLADFANKYGVSSISYSIKSESAAETYYKISDNTLALTGTETPPSNCGDVTCTVKFSDDSQVEIDLSVLYVAASNSASNYLIYYNSYNSEVPISTYTSFVMNFYDSAGVYTVYDFAYNYTTAQIESSDGETYTRYIDSTDGATALTFGAPGAISLTFASDVVYDDDGNIKSYATIKEFSYGEGTDSLTGQFDSWLDTRSLSTYRNAVWIVTVDQSKLAISDVEMLLLYNYKFEDSTKWNTYTQTIATSSDTDGTAYYTPSTVTAFTLQGGVYHSSTANNGYVTYENLFAWMLEAYMDGAETTFIPTSALGQSATMDVTTDSDLLNVDWTSAYTILQYLTGLTEANLSGVTSITVDILNKMTQLQKLTLQNCGLTETTIGGLQLENLRELDVSNNSIMSYDWLNKTDFPSLEVAYVYKNESSNSYTGSSGMSNYQQFEDLRLDGVTVYNTLNANNQPIAYENADENSDYARLKALMYRSIIDSDTDIKTVYSMFTSLTSDDLKLSEEYSLKWGDNSSTEKADSKEYFYVTATYSSYTLTVKYYVYRVTSSS